MPRYLYVEEGVLLGDSDTDPRGFPAQKLDPWGIEAQHPDEFLSRQFHLSQPASITASRASLRYF